MIDPDLMKRINRRAYEIWESEGKPEGRARIHWLRAEAEFREKFCRGQFRIERRSAPNAFDTFRPPAASPRDTHFHR